MNKKKIGTRRDSKFRTAKRLNLNPQLRFSISLERERGGRESNDCTQNIDPSIFPPFSFILGRGEEE